MKALAPFFALMSSLSPSLYLYVSLPLSPALSLSLSPPYAHPGQVKVTLSHYREPRYNR